MKMKLEEKIARVILDSTSMDKKNVVYKDILVEKLAQIFQDERKRFNAEKFKKACYYFSEEYYDAINYFMFPGFRGI